MVDIEVLYYLLKEVREDQKKHGDELMHQSNTLVAIQKDVEINTRDLTEHKEGVVQNRDSIHMFRKELDNVKETFGKEIEKLKEPIRFKEYVYNRYTKIAGVITVTVGIVAGILGILGYL